MPFQYLLGTTGNNQLFNDNHLWYNTKARLNYWTCIEIGCNAKLSTNGDKLHMISLIAFMITISGTTPRLGPTIGLS